MGFIAAAWLAFSALACGSSGGGIGGTGIVFGTVTAVDEVTVAGVRFDLSTATVTIDGEPSSQADIELGMVARIVGEIDEADAFGLAETVEINSVVEGPIDALSADRAVVSVLGDRVAVSDETVLASIILDADAVGGSARVSGFVDADGVVRATRIEGLEGAVDSGFVVSGTITSVDEDAETFVVRQVTIDYATAALEGFAPGVLRPGTEVRMIIAAKPEDGNAVALTVVFLSPPPESVAATRVQLEGVVTARPGLRSFILNNRNLIRLTADTTISGGDQADIVVNRSVSVTGVVVDGSREINAVVVRLQRLFDAVPAEPALPQPLD